MEEDMEIEQEIILNQDEEETEQKEPEMKKKTVLSSKPKTREWVASYLSKFYELLGNPSSQNEPLALVQDLRNLCFNEVSEKDLDYVSSLLFSSENNLLEFLKRAISLHDKDIVKTREAILKFIYHFIKKLVGKNIQEYAFQIKDTCFSLFRREQSNLVRIATFKPLIELIQLQLQILDGEKLGIREMTEIYLQEYITGKSSQTVKSCILQILGVFTQYYPTYMEDKASQVLQILLDSLNKQFKSKKPEMQVISGAIKGMTSFLVHYNSLFLKDPNNIQTFYHYLCLALEPPPHLQRYDIPKAALQFITTHSVILKQYLTEDSENMYSRLSKLCKHQNDKVRQKAFPALDAFFLRVANELVSGVRNEQSDQQTFKFFMKKFNDNLESAVNADVSISIRGFGKFAGPVLQFLGENELGRLLTKLFVVYEKTYVGSETEDSILHISSFLSSYANIIFFMGQIEESHIENLAKQVGKLFLIYPQLWSSRRRNHSEALYRLFVAVYSKGALKSLLSKVVFQGLMLTCSIDNETSKFLYEDYLHLWKYLLKTEGIPDLDISKETLHQISSFIYDELISSILLFIQKLNLNYLLKSGTAFDMIPNVPRDMDIFLLLVDFCKLLLPDTCTEFFDRWIYIFSKEMISRSYELPLLSGFYKLLTIALNISKERNLFELQSKPLQEGEDSHIENDENIHLCKILFSKFIKEVLVRIQQYKDELLISCLELILSIPASFLKEDISGFISALNMAFKIGLSYNPMAYTALNTFEYWLRMERELIESRLTLLLPNLNDYLLTESSKNSSSNSIQLRIIGLLGKLGGSAIYLIDTVNLTSSNAISWDSTPRVKFTLPFRDMRSDIYLDSFLPRIVELATNSNDRPTKIAACELLHSIILVMIGNNAKKSPVPLKKLYGHIGPALIKLATDVDQVAKKLFEPLLIQMIHWFTSNSKNENEETMSILESILEYLGNSSNGAIRSFCAECLAEFFTWSLKHISKKQQDSNPFNIKSLFKQLYSLARHPNPYKRLGCTQTFQKIYKLFREEQSLVDMFVLEIFYNMIFSLRLCQNDDPSMRAAEEIQKLIQDMMKLVVHYAQLLNIENHKRRQFSSLQEFASFVLKEIGRHEAISRAECTKIFETLAPLLPGGHSAGDWIQEQLHDETNGPIVISIFEPCAKKNVSIGQLKHGTDELEFWFSSLLTSLECYSWAFERRFFQPKIFSDINSILLSQLNHFINEFGLLQRNHPNLKTFSPSEIEKLYSLKCILIIRLFQFMVILIQKYSDPRIKGFLSKTPLFFDVLFLSLLNPSSIGFNLNNSIQLNELYTQSSTLCKNLVTFLDQSFLNLMIEKGTSLLRKEEFQLLAHLNPKTKGFNVQDSICLVDGLEQLNTSGILILDMSAETFGKELLGTIFDNAQYYSPSQKLVAQRALNLVFKLEFQPSTLIEFLTDETVFHEQSVILPVSLGTMEEISSSQFTPQSTQQTLSSSHKSATISFKKITKGEIFYDNFKDQIDSYFIKNFTSYSNLTFSKLSNPLILKILLNILEKLKQTNKSSSNQIQTVISEILKWKSLLIDWLTQSKNEKLVIEQALELTFKMSALDSQQIIQNSGGKLWIKTIFEKTMGRGSPLSLKTKSLDLLPLMLELDERTTKDLLNSLTVNDFPSNSKSLVPNTPTCNQYLLCIDKLLHALEITESLALLEVLFPILRETDHIHKVAIEKSLSNYVQKLSEENAKTTFDFCFEHFLDKSLPEDLRSMLINRICIPIIEKIPTPLQIEIFEAKIGVIMKLATSNAIGLREPLEKKIYLLDKICAFNLIHMLYSCLSPNFIKETINKKYCNLSDAKGNELTTAIMRAAHSSIHESLATGGDEQLPSLLREYHCRAYNTLASIVINTQTKEQFFTVFFFKEIPEKDELIWENLVNLEKTFTFPVETNFATSKIEIKKLSAQIEPEIKRTTSNSSKQFLHYFQSSSLVTNLSEVTVSNDQINLNCPPSEPKTSSGEPKSQDQQENNLELDELNRHPCMPTILKLIDVIQEKFGAQNDPKAMPSWMLSLHSKFLEIDTKPNILLFILKIVVNRSLLFKPYSSFWFIPILKFLITNNFGEGINYFVRDVCLMLLQWEVKPQKSTEHFNVISHFLDFLIKQAPSSSKEILRSNIELIRLFVQSWKGKFSISKKQIQDMLSNASKQVVLTAIQVLGVLAMSGIPLYDKEFDSSISEFKFYDVLLNNLHSSKDIYCATSEVSGLALLQAKDNMEQDDTFGQLLRDKINAIFTKHETDRGLNCLFRIGTYYPPFLVEKVNLIFNFLPNVKGEFKAITLQLILWIADDISDLELRIVPELPKLISHREEESQLLTLKIILKLLKQNTSLINILDSLIQTFSKHPSQECRQLYYQIITWFYENVPSTVSTLSVPLLMGLADDSETIYSNSFAFWDRHLSSETSSRLIQVFSSLYSKTVEEKWLGFASSLLLHLSSKSPDYEHFLFDALKQTEFKEYHIDPSIQSSFQVSYFSTGPQIDVSSTEGNSGEIRATQIPQFPSTQIGEMEIEGTQTLQKLSSNLIFRPSFSNETVPIGTFTIGSKPPSQTKKGEFTQPSVPSSIQRRFKPVSQRRFTRAELQKIQYAKQHKPQFTARIKAARSNQVSMKRKYRTGELPDIQIKLKEVIEPLQSLVKFDANFARIVFPILFKSIYEAISPAEQENLKPDIQINLEKLLESTNYTTPFIGSLLSISFDMPELISSPQLIGEASLKSFNFHSGIVLLEKQILIITSEEKSKKKKIGVTSNALLSQMWTQLAKLYKALEDEDILRGLTDKNAKHPFTKSALDYELKGDYVEALKLYNKGFQHLDANSWEDQPPPTQQEIRYWENARLECFVKLTRWDDLSQNVIAEVDNDLEKLFDPKFRDPLLSYFMKSHIKLKQLWPDLWKVVDSHLNELESNFSDELALITLTRNDFSKARFFITKFYEQFISDWGKLQVFDKIGKHAKLQSLQQVEEMKEFLDFTSKESNFTSIDSVDKLIEPWRHRWPSSRLDPINVWDDVVTTRAILLEKLNERYLTYQKGSDAMEIEEGHTTTSVGLTVLKSKLINERAQFFREMAMGARKQNNFYVADHYLKLCLKAYKKDFIFSVFDSLVKLYCSKAKYESDLDQSVDKFFKAQKFIISKQNESTIKENENNKRRFFILKGNVYEELAILNQKLNNSQTLIDLVKNEGSSIEINHNTKYLTEELYYHAYKSFLQAAKSSNLNSVEEKEIRFTGKAFFQFGNFCDKLLKSFEESKLQSGAHSLNLIRDRLPTNIIENILHAINYQSTKARDKFPRLLELISIYPDTQELFNEKIASIPSWAFIRWLSQIMALLNKSESKAIIPLLTRLATSYPQAVYYPFKISTENFDAKTEKLIRPIKQALGSTILLDMFVASLEKLTHPEHRFKDWIEKLKPLLKLAERNEAKIKELFLQIYEDVFDASIPNIGSYNKKFALAYSKSFVDNFGKDGSKIIHEDTDKIILLAADMIAQMMKNIAPKGTTKVKLSEFSEFLLDFEQSSQGTSEYIELPGQYTGLNKPQPEFHIRISSFDSTLLVMSSLRKPKRIKIHGNDEKDYLFLVKGGEDLRLDQRVQQLFSVMNQTFVSDPACAKRGLQVHTYQVVPMTSKVGVIEWIEETKPLKEILEIEYAKSEGKAPESVNILKAQGAVLQQGWINSFESKLKGKKRNVCDLYYVMYQLANRDETAKQLYKQQNTLPDDLLRRAISSLASSSETYLLIRTQFARTLAVFNICSYVIGIGDRHLENFLLNLRDGGLIGIDFGHAFGTATQFLPIPELIPFRLTRQLIQFLQPLDADGLLKHNMVHALSALKENQDTLLNTMDVFIKEPLLDWEKLARKLAVEQGGNGEEEDQQSTWFPRKKIAIAKMKLEGYNPAHITSQELAESVHASNSYLKSLQQIVKGDAAVNIRARTGEICSSTKEQVDCLIDQATDPNILGRTYFGWAPWV